MRARYSLTLLKDYCAGPGTDPAAAPHRVRHRQMQPLRLPLTAVHPGRANEPRTMQPPPVYGGMSSKLLMQSHTHKLALLAIPCGMDSVWYPASWIGRLSSWSNYRCCFFISRVNDHERTDEPNFQDEYNGVPGKERTAKPMAPRITASQARSGQPNQWLRTYDRIQHSNRPDLQKNKIRAVSLGPPLNQPSSRVRATSFKF